MKKTGKIVTVGILVLAILVFGTQWQSIANYATNSVQKTAQQPVPSPTNPSPTSSSAGYSGSVSIYDTVTNGLTNAALTDNTNVQVTIYQQNPDGTYRGLGTLSSNTLTNGINATPQITQLFVGMVIPSGQAYYPAVDKMGTAYYSRFGQMFWGTPNFSNLPQPVYPLNMQNLNQLGTGLTAPSLSLPIVLYTASTATGVNSNGCTTGASASCGGTTYVSNTNKTGVGAGLVQNQETIPYTFGTSATAIAEYQFSITLNDTTLSDINTALSSCTFPTGLSGTGPSVTMPWTPSALVQMIPGSTTTKYIFNIATDGTIKTAPYIEVPKIGNNQVNIVCTIATNFAATNNGATFSPTLTWIDMQAVLNTVNTHIFKIVA